MTTLAHLAVAVFAVTVVYIALARPLLDLAAHLSP